MTSAPDTKETGTRARTRLAILEAAAGILPTRPTASLTEIATAADVGRSTLHRYFPDRADLLAALAHHMLERLEADFQRAEPDIGDPVDALRRVAEAIIDRGPAMTYLYNEPTLAQHEELWGEVDPAADPVSRILDRASDRLRGDLSREWIVKCFWSLVYVGWESMRDGSMPRAVVLDSIITTMTSGILRHD
ncbi:TetR/AcrR family transcriptional regulator [Ornithinicoccus hortensis]|uniref:TetR family transcriptional regulator n=1 Tax=Ornithinicoccus hortensis TaxID=82346 RepID=A0A542YV83_9MICO|nr:TetR/AcrR family transcriptional regulator [Ornithinicoccus hortensis]TQL51991.1 TetR family transcriptional regulator [Ornithinicoccus hortensis]